MSLTRLECMGIHPNDIERADDKMFEVLELLHFTEDEIDAVEEELNNIPKELKDNSLPFETNIVITEIFITGQNAIWDKFPIFFQDHDIEEEVKWDASGYTSSFSVSDDLLKYANKRLN